MPIDPARLEATAKLTFADEFDSLSLWDGQTGVWATNWWYNDDAKGPAASPGATLASNGELQWYVNANYPATAELRPWSVKDGVLSLEASRVSDEAAKLIEDHGFASGMVNSWRSFSQTFGYFEISAKLPAGQGLWPAFWLLPTSGRWPPEIDVMEFLGHQPTSYFVSLHSAASGEHEAASRQVQGVDLTAGFHRYGVNWQADVIGFYFDGAKVAEMPTPTDLKGPMYMILNLAVGGHWPGPPNAQTPFPARFDIDYVRVYQARTKAEPPSEAAGAVSEAMGDATPARLGPWARAGEAAGAADAAGGGHAAASAGLNSSYDLGLERHGAEVRIVGPRVLAPDGFEDWLFAP